MAKNKEKRIGCSEGQMGPSTILEARNSAVSSSVRMQTKWLLTF